MILNDNKNIKINVLDERKMIMFTMFKSKAGQGRSNEMLRRFMSDSRPSIYISNEMTTCNIEDKVNRIRMQGYGLNVPDWKYATSISGRNTVDDYMRIIMRNKDKVLYLDLSVNMEIREVIKTYCANISLHYRDVYMTEQLRSGAMDGVLIVKES